MEGKISKIFGAKGYGYISSALLDDILFHISECNEWPYEQEEIVTFDIKNSRAINVKKINNIEAEKSLNARKEFLKYIFIEGIKVDDFVVRELCRWADNPTQAWKDNIEGSLRQYLEVAEMI